MPSHPSYRLPCPCGSYVSVSVSQAGSEEHCSQCGQLLRVPSLAQVKQLEMVTPVTPITQTASSNRWILLLIPILFVLIITIVWISSQSGGTTERVSKRPDSSTIPATPLPQQNGNQNLTSVDPALPSESDSGSEIPADTRPKVTLDVLDYIGQLNLRNYTHSEDSIGSALIKLASLRQEPDQQSIKRLQQEFRIQSIDETLSLPDRKLGELRRHHILAEHLRESAQESALLSVAVKQAKVDLEHLGELGAILKSTSRIRKYGTSQFQQRVQQQYTQLPDQTDDTSLTKRKEQLQSLLELPPDELIVQYSQTTFATAWVDREEKLIQVTHQDLQDRLNISAEMGITLLEKSTEDFRKWVQLQRPSLIRKEFEELISMHGQLMQNTLGTEQQERLRTLYQQWQIEPTEAPELLKNEDPALLQKMNQRRLQDIRQTLIDWISFQTSNRGEQLGQNAPQLEDLALAYQLQPSMGAIRDFLESDPTLQLEHVRNVNANNWKQAIQRIVDTQKLLDAPLELRRTATLRAAELFRSFLTETLLNVQSLLPLEQIPENILNELEKETESLRSFLELDNNKLMELCDQGVRHRLLPGTIVDLVTEQQNLNTLYDISTTELEKILQPENLSDLERFAMRSAARRMRNELTLLASPSQPGARNAVFREQLFQKYQMPNSELSRVVQFPDTLLWKWNVERLSRLIAMPDTVVLEQLREALPSEIQDPSIPIADFDTLGQEQRHLIAQEFDLLEREIELSIDQDELARPLPQTNSTAHQLLRAQLQNHLQPMSEYLPLMISDETMRSEISQMRDFTDVFAPDQPAPAWMGLLHSGLLQARYQLHTDDSEGELAIFLPVTEDLIDKPNAASLAYEKWYGIIRLMTGHIFEPESSVRLRVFAYFNEYPTCKLWLNPDPMVSSHSSMYPPEKKQSIDLTLWYEQLMQSQLDGIEIVDVGGERQLWLSGQPLDDAGSESLTILGRPLDLQDFAVAYRAVVYGGDNQPFQSLDASSHPALANASFGGYLENTALGQVLLNADLTFKFLASGLDPFQSVLMDRRDDFAMILERHGLPAFEPVYDQFARVEPGNEPLQETRFWLSLRSAQGTQGNFFDWRADATGAQVLNPFFVAEARKRSTDGRELPASELPVWTQSSIEHFNQNRQAYESLYPVLKEVRSVGILLALSKWIKDFNIQESFDLDVLLDVPIDPITTPRQRLRGMYASVINETGEVQSYDCTHLVGQLEDTPLEQLPPALFETWAYVASASFALMNTWEDLNPQISSVYRNIHTLVIQSMKQLDQQSEEQLKAELTDLRTQLFNVPQRQWTVGCAWISTGGIDLTLPPARRFEVKRKGSRSRLRRTRRNPQRRPTLKSLLDRSRNTLKTSSDRGNVKNPKNNTPKERSRKINESKPLPNVNNRNSERSPRLQRKGNRLRLRRQRRASPT